MKNRMMSILLVLVLLATCAAPVFSAGDVTEQVEALRVRLEDKYGITITYDQNEDATPCLGAGSMMVLDKALHPVTASVVRQVSDYYENKLGNRLGIAYRYSPYHEPDSNVEILASFNPETAQIEIYMPSTSQGTFTTGNSPVTIAHEFAHAYYFMFTDQYGEEEMEREWVRLNGGVRYNEGYIALAYNKVTFMSGYGATSLEEDFAEIFSNAFVRHREGQGFHHRLLNGDRKTALGKKVEFIEKMLPMYMTGTDQAVANLRRIYTTPYTLYYQDIKLSGEYLQFMDCAYPRFVLGGLLSRNSLRQEQSAWVKEIGGWHVKCTNGKYYLVFPGGPVIELAQSLQSAA